MSHRAYKEFLSVLWSLLYLSYIHVCVMHEKKTKTFARASSVQGMSQGQSAPAPCILSLVKVFNIITSLTWASQVVRVVKNPPANAGDAKDTGSIPGSGRLPWRRKWQPTPVLLPGKVHGQRSLPGYSPRGCQELDTTEHTLSSRAGGGRWGASICCTYPKGQAVGSLSCCPCFLG